MIPILNLMTINNRGFMAFFQSFNHLRGRISTFDISMYYEGVSFKITKPISHSYTEKIGMSNVEMRPLFMLRCDPFLLSFTPLSSYGGVPQP